MRLSHQLWHIRWLKIFASLKYLEECLTPTLPTLRVNMKDKRRVCMETSTFLPRASKPTRNLM
ncbi:wsv156 [White spot syndrome virus]|uniref:Wsv156 n=4 Tax=White spot syndrome virus TaxID=342409 RepID=Q8VB41_WSSVS|nr:wsv156 [Shrimp white spot syndrome virus]AFX59534.1 wsv156 [White spot syndrome virus]AAL33160.1 wsv156 [Shrimp white spot syndrome virus]AAL89080.1 WSSV212 [Shrimp white spot syndrome virus]AWQ60338.1 wsv156 [Shrimp white spot syndrome virus]AWQ60751.1 wsv156 [Shrimp white spot syndrome virus]